MGNWRDKAEEEAKAAANYLYDDIVEAVLDAQGKTKKENIHQFSDSYASESIGDSHYGLREAADLLEDLYEFEADDEGLWEGLKPRDAISVMAGETFRSAVESMFTDLMEEINDAVESPDIIWDFDEWLEQVKGQKGVLDWSPDDEETEEFREGAEKIYKERLKSAVKEAVKEAIEAW